MCITLHHSGAVRQGRNSMNESFRFQLGRISIVAKIAKAPIEEISNATRLLASHLQLI